jgi:hypothetical protein
MSFPHASQFWWILENRSDQLILDGRIPGADIGGHVSRSDASGILESLIERHDHVINSGRVGDTIPDKFARFGRDVLVHAPILLHGSWAPTTSLGVAGRTTGTGF